MKDIQKNIHSPFTIVPFFYLSKILTLSIIFLFLHLLNSWPAHGLTKFYSIQVGSYKDLNNAVEEISRLEKTVHNTFYRHETIKGKGKWYRVYIDRHRSKVEAEKKARILMQADIISNYYIRVIEEEGQRGSLKSEYHKKGYYLHLNSFLQKINAEREVQRLKKHGYKTHLASTEVSGQKWFKVYLGTFDDEQGAVKAGSELKEKGIISFFKPKQIDRITPPTSSSLLPRQEGGGIIDKRKGLPRLPRVAKPFGQGGGEKAESIKRRRGEEEKKDKKTKRVRVDTESAGLTNKDGDDTAAGSDSLLPEGLVIKGKFRPGFGAQVGHVLLVQGKVVIMHTDRSLGYWAKKTIPLFKGDTIFTQKKGRIRFKLNDESIMVLGSGTKLVLNRSAYDSRGKTRSAFLGLKLGKARFWVKKLFGFRRSEFRIKTPTAIVGVRGSDFFIRATPKVTEVTTFEETKLEVVSTAAPEAAPTLLEGFERTVVQENALPTEVERVTPEEADLMKKDFSISPETSEQEGKLEKKEKKAKDKDDKGAKSEKKAETEKGTTEKVGTGEDKEGEGEGTADTEGGTTGETEAGEDKEEGGEGTADTEEGTTVGAAAEETTSEETTSEETTGEEAVTTEASTDEAPAEDAGVEEAPSGETTTVVAGVGETSMLEAPSGESGAEEPIGSVEEIGVLVSDEELIAPEDPVVTEVFEEPLLLEISATEEIYSQIEEIQIQQAQEEVTATTQTQTTQEPVVVTIPKLPPFPGTP